MFIYKKINALLSPNERKQLPTLVLFILIGMLLEMLGIGLIIPILGLMADNNLLNSYPSLKPLLGNLEKSSQSRLVADGMLLLFGAYVLKALFMIFMFIKQNKFTYNLQASLSERLYAGYLYQPWSFHLQRNSAQLMNNVTNAANQFSFTIQAFMIVLTESAVLFGIAILMLIIEPLAAPLVIAVMGSAAWLFQRCSQNFILRMGTERLYHTGMRMQHIQQGLGGAKEVKLAGREREFVVDFHLHNEGIARTAKALKTISDLPRLWLELLAIGGMTMLVVILLAQGTKLSASIPILAFFTAAAFRIIPSVNRILAAIQTINSDYPIINQLYDEIQLIDNLTIPPDTQKLPFTNKLQLDHVSYRYTNAKSEALIDISITIPRGTSVGFTGTSGAGKTTLIDVLSGLLAPDHGHVLVDGVDIQTNLRGWQDQIGYVPQTIFLTDDTLRRNIAFNIASEQIDDKAVLHAIKAAQLEEFVNSLPEGTNTYVGERGVRLSGGQRQRIGIARALYHDPAVLILDEATSALDLATEKGVMEAINALHGIKTILIIAHRLSTIVNCDHVYKMEHGRIMTAGAAV